MSRKDYVLIAAGFANARFGLKADDLRSVGLNRAMIEVGAVLAKDNDRFDRVRFYKACGLKDASHRWTMPTQRAPGSAPAVQVRSNHALHQRTDHRW